MLSPHAALEQSMGLTTGADDMEVDGCGIPDEDPDATPPGRAAVSYSTAGDSLFSPPAPVTSTLGSSAAGSEADAEESEADAVPARLLRLRPGDLLLEHRHDHLRVHRAQLLSPQRAGEPKAGGRNDRGSSRGGDDTSRKAPLPALRKSFERPRA